MNPARIQNDEVDCAGNSLLPQFLTQPQDASVSCNGVHRCAELNVQVAPAAIAYYNLLPESCYDTNTEVPLTFTESVIPEIVLGITPFSVFGKLWIATALKTVFANH